MHQRFLAIAIAITVSVPITLQAQSFGLFEQSSDIGAVQHAGSAVYDSAAQQYQLSGSGANIWGASDQFQFLWKKMSGDFILQARGNFIGNGVDPHRKWGWMVRSSLDTNAAMASVQIHGDGLAAFQYRASVGAPVAEKRSDVKAPDVIQLERTGNKYIMSIARFGDPYSEIVMDSVLLPNDVYVGLFVCAHNNKVVENAAFGNVRIVVPAGGDLVPYKQYLGSHIELLDVDSGNRRIVYSSPESLQAPNWLPSGNELIYNSNGLIYKLNLQTHNTDVLNTGFVKANNNDHVLSFDGKMLGLSSSSADPKLGSIIYTMPITGGTPKQITPTGPSYLHGWSPDKKYLVFTGQRNGDFDIYRVPAAGGPEVKLTSEKGLDDGPEYSPDGKYIYFNSVRSGSMQLWRMNADGRRPEQLTNDGFHNWFPHLSPDGKWIVFLSFLQSEVKADDHPFYKHVYLRKMPVRGGTPKVIAYVYGGQGTINTPSWSPDGKRVAFVSNTGMK